jgi:Lysyl oxidase
MRTIAAAALALALASCSGASDEAPEVLPDLDQVAPRALSVIEDDGRERLVFISAVENVGRGALVVSGRRAETLAAEMAARQLVEQADGGNAEYPLRLRLEFVVSETHRHWHLLDFERYELRTPAGEPVGEDRKTGFCLGDRYDARGSVRIPGEPPRAAWTQNCGKDEPERLSVLQGISPGYGDDYVPTLEGQFIDVTDVPAGRYVLVHRVNPQGDIREASYANNAASVLLELRRPAGSLPEVEVLATCQASELCGTSTA